MDNQLHHGTASWHWISVAEPHIAPLLNTHDLIWQLFHK
jgi:hypothetical protein